MVVQDAFLFGDPLVELMGEALQAIGADGSDGSTFRPR